MDKLTFKEYIDSKDRLRKAIQETPIASANYVVKKYCKIRIGESRDARQEIALKPKQIITVEWRYDDINNPEPISVMLESTGEQENPVYWTGEKLKSWLSKNAFEELHFDSNFV